MFNLDKFISDCVTFRPISMFSADIEANKETLSKEIEGKKEPYFAKIIKVTEDMTLDADLYVGAFAAYLKISFGTCSGFGFGTVIRMTPSYVYIDTGNGEVVRKSTDKVRWLR